MVPQELLAQMVPQELPVLIYRVVVTLMEAVVEVAVEEEQGEVEALEGLCILKPQQLLRGLLPQVEGAGVLPAMEQTVEWAVTLTAAPAEVMPGEVMEAVVEVEL